MTDIFVWSFIGMILMAIEILLMPGMGILFSGFGAITVAFLIYNDMENMTGNLGGQIMNFLMATGFWSTILWYPLKTFYGYSAEDEYKHIIGTIGTVQKLFTRDEIGSLTWSGSLVRCKIDPESKSDQIDAKSHVKITNVVDGIYIVKPVREEIEGFKDRDTILKEQEEAKQKAREESSNDAANNAIDGLTGGK